MRSIFHLLAAGTADARVLIETCMPHLARFTSRHSTLYAHISRARRWTCPLASCPHQAARTLHGMACQHLFRNRLRATESLPLGLISGPNALKNQRWLLSFFLFCSFKQKRICMGHALEEISPVSVTMTCEVNLCIDGKRVRPCPCLVRAVTHSNKCAVTSLPPTVSLGIPS